MDIWQEIGEEIMNGIIDSFILKKLGGRENIGTHQEVIKELERLGYYEFMSFGGKDNAGYYEPYGISVKLMNCPQLKWPLMVELEKTAATEEEAKQREKELYELSRKLQLQDRLIKEEPPSMLYAALSGN